MRSTRFTVSTYFVLHTEDDYICQAAPVGPGASVVCARSMPLSATS